MEENEVIKAIGALSKKIDDEFDTVKTRIAQNANDSLKHHEKTRKDIAQIRGHVVLLWRKVNGSDPPPPPPPPQKHDVEGRVVEEIPFSEEVPVSAPLPMVTDAMPLDEMARAGFTKASALDLEVAALRAETIVGFSKIEQQVRGVLTINKTQSDYAGIGKKGRTYLFSREGIKATATLIAAVTGLVAALGTCYALLTRSPQVSLEPTPPRGDVRSGP